MFYTKYTTKKRIERVSLLLTALFFTIFRSVMMMELIEVENQERDKRERKGLSRCISK